MAIYYYDEPTKEQNWIKIQNMVPWAQRVDGVKGTDAAHKSAAALSDTDRFILIDGDNIPHPAFLILAYVLTLHAIIKFFGGKHKIK